MTISVNIPVQYFQEGKYIIAYSPALDISTYAKTLEEAKKRFSKELNIFLEYTLKHGTLPNVLLDLGWILQKKPTPRFTPPPVKKPDVSRTKFGKFISSTQKKLSLSI